MLEAAIIGRWRSTPGVFSMRRRILLLRRFNWRWTLAFTRKPPGGERSRGVKYLDYSLKPGGFRVSGPRPASDYAWLRVSLPPRGAGRVQQQQARHARLRILAELLAGKLRPLGRGGNADGDLAPRLGVAREKALKESRLAGWPVFSR